MICKGKKQSGPHKGEPCEKPALKGREHCRKHGGKTLAGPAHPNFKHGERSKYFDVPARMAKKVQAAMDDSQLTQHRRLAAVLEVRAYELLASGESELLWAKAQTALDRVLAAIRDKNAEAQSASLAELHNLLTRGHQDSLRWAEFRVTAEQASREKERENRRLLQMEQMVSFEHMMEELLAYVGIVVNVATETIKDRAVLRQFVDRLNAVTPRTHEAGDRHPASTNH